MVEIDKKLNAKNRNVQLVMEKMYLEKCWNFMSENVQIW
jgi:hypothetical protein